ncbi:hypothetical protein COCNU_contig69092098G000010 [Cocos nucifera]|nr:hypothetical protein [Cocos nucifera]
MHKSDKVQNLSDIIEKELEARVSLFHGARLHLLSQELPNVLALPIVNSVH